MKVYAIAYKYFEDSRAYYWEECHRFSNRTSVFQHSCPYAIQSALLRIMFITVVYSPVCAKAVLMPKWQPSSFKSHSDWLAWCLFLLISVEWVMQKCLNIKTKSAFWQLFLFQCWSLSGSCMPLGELWWFWWLKWFFCLTAAENNFDHKLGKCSTHILTNNPKFQIQMSDKLKRKVWLCGVGILLVYFATSINHNAYAATLAVTEHMDDFEVMC